MFVAGFLGAPPMNFVRGQLSDKLVFKESGEGVIELTLPPEARPYAGREVILGVRPEDIVLQRRFPSLIEIVEQTGAETHLHLQTGANVLVCRTPASISSEEAGHRMQFDIDPAKVHLFDAATSARLAIPKSEIRNPI
jgi:multiple sugar transport system ATP-binding protein